MMKHRVGDTVKIRKDLEVGKFYGRCFFVPEMQDLCGKTTRIAKVLKDDGCYCIDSSTKCWTDEMFEDMEVQEMHKSVTISVVGNKVIAHCDSKRGVARCHPDDTFDFFVGAKLALERLEEAEKPYGWLKEGMRYYIPSVDCIALYDSYVYDANEWNNRFMERGIVFQTKQEAIACAKKMLAAVKQEG